jgi:hypothetical protein
MIIVTIRQITLLIKAILPVDNYENVRAIVIVTKIVKEAYDVSKEMQARNKFLDVRLEGRVILHSMITVTTQQQQH